MTEEEVNKFEKVQAQLEGLYNEIGVLSRKSPNDAINKFKLKFFNQVLVSANVFLVGSYKPFDGFEIFEDADLPSNSDATMIFEQYLNCLEKLRADNITTKDYIAGWFWMVDGKASSIKTLAPQKLRQK